MPYDLTVDEFNSLPLLIKDRITETKGSGILAAVRKISPSFKGLPTTSANLDKMKYAVMGRFEFLMREAMERIPPYYFAPEYSFNHGFPTATLFFDIKRFND
jgi:hypothetical protein